MKDLRKVLQEEASRPGDVDEQALEVVSPEDSRKHRLQLVQALMFPTLAGVPLGVLVGYWATVVFMVVMCPHPRNPVWRAQPFSVITDDERRQAAWTFSLRLQLGCLIVFWFCMRDTPYYFLALFYPFIYGIKTACYRKLQGFEKTRVMGTKLNCFGIISLPVWLVAVLSCTLSVAVALLGGAYVIYPLLAVLLVYIVARRRQLGAATCNKWMLVWFDAAVIPAVLFVPESFNTVPLYMWVGLMTAVLEEAGLFGETSSNSSGKELEEKDPELAHHQRPRKDIDNDDAPSEKEELRQALLE